VPKVFFILGAPRCGTSLVAGILHKSGVSAGEQLQAHEQDNPAGFFEDYLLTAINIGFLRAAGGSHIFPPSFSEIEGVMDYPITESSQFGRGLTAIGTAIKYLARRNRAGRDWCAKDPRVILTWPIWAPAVAMSQDVNLHFIVTHRNVLDAAQSWVKCDYMKDTQYALGVVLEYMYRLSAIVWLAERKYPALHLSFEGWWRDFQSQADALEEFVGRDLDFSHFEGSLWRS